MQDFSGLAPTAQGTIGVGIAIGYYSSHGYIVSVPLTDIQKYDLLIDNGDGIKKVQVKTARRRINGKYEVELRTVCPKKTTKNIITKFDSSLVDYLFIALDDGRKYNIPCSEINVKSGITITKKLDRYSV